MTGGTEWQLCPETDMWSLLTSPLVHSAHRCSGLASSYMGIHDPCTFWGEGGADFALGTNTDSPGMAVHWFETTFVTHLVFSPTGTPTLE